MSGPGAFSKRTYWGLVGTYHKAVVQFKYTALYGRGSLAVISMSLLGFEKPNYGTGVCEVETFETG